VKRKKQSSPDTQSSHSSKLQKETSPAELVKKLDPAKHGKLYSLRELVIFLRVNENSPFIGYHNLMEFLQIFKEQKPPLTIVEYQTLYRRVKAYETSKVRRQKCCHERATMG
jgi:hypothetical protein